MEVAGVVLDRSVRQADRTADEASGVMGSTRGPDGIVVGVDDSLGVLAAVSWAASEAAATGVPLRLVHVAADTADTADTAGSAAGRAWLRRALGTAAAVAPEVAITVAQLDGPPARALGEHAEHAEHLVVGGRRRHDAADPFADRTVAHLLACARCPVVVVPPCRTGAWASTPSPRPVVAGLRGTDDDRSTLELAAGAARRRGVALVAAISGPAARRRTALAHARRAGASRLEVADDLGDSLRHLAQQAQLVVVGAADRMTAAEASHGDLERLLHHRRCAVMVAPPR